MDLVVILDNVRSAYNVGSVIRSLACANGKELATCGYTPSFKHPKVAKTSLQAENAVSHQQFESLKDAIEHYQSLGYQIFVLENGGELNIWQTNFFEERKAKIAMILGNEVEGVQLEVTNDYKLKVLEIPMLGSKGSLNIASAAAIAIFEVARQFSI